MKKILLSLMILLLWTGSSWGQVNLYSFSSSSGTYTAISGGTLLISGTSTMDSWASTVQTIPSFTFDDVNYTTAYVTSNGILTLGGAAPSAYTTTGISTTTGSGIAICPFSADLDRATQTTSTEIRWETIGDEIIFQWQQVKRYAQTESFDFQVRLNTVNGEVRFIYQLNSGPGSGTSYQPQVGIRTSTTDYKNRLVASGAENWDTSLPGTSNTNTCRFTSAAPAKNFTTGLTYTFTPPLPCSGTPDPGNTVSSLEYACSGVDFTLSLQNFVPGTGITYQWQSSVTGGEPWTDMGTAATQVASQTVPTYYRCYVTCENSEESAFSNSLLVSMFVAPVPYEEGFLTTAVPPCWNTTGWLIGSVRGVTGNPGNNIYKNIYGTGSTGASFKTCEIGPISAGMVLTFDYKVANYSSPYAPPAANSGNFVVAVSADGGTNFTDLETVANNGIAGWQTKSYPLDDYDGKNIIIKITGNWVSGDWDMAFDNIKVAVPPACPPPTNLVVSEIAKYSAKISWIPGDVEIIWNLKYGAPGFDPETEGTLVENIQTNSHTISGLSASTQYQVYVQADCNGTLSPWSIAVSFVTECDAFTLPFAEDFEGATFPPMCWGVFDLNNDATLWTSGTTNHTPGGLKSAYHNYSYGGGGLGSDGWLVTPQFQLPENTVINLSFWSNHTFPTYYTKNAVLISTGSGNPVDGDFEEIWSPASVTASWVKTDLDLTSYAGQMVYIAFQYEGYDGHAWYLDDILIESFVPGNLAGNVSGGRGPIEGARVFGNGFEAFTDENGDYLIEDIIAGTYDITCEAEGFLTKLEEDFEIEGGDNTLDFVLNFAQIAVDPDSFEVEILPGGQKTEMLNISNPAGTGPLTWSAIIKYQSGRSTSSVQPFTYGEIVEMNNTDKSKDACETTTTVSGGQTRDTWDILQSFSVSDGGEQGIATDGEYIYTAFWGTNGKFGKYTLAGEFIETFIIANVGGIRDLTYDGTYFYGGGGATTIYKLDFAKKTLEGTITSPVNVRHLSYDPVEDAFWCGDWTSLRLVSRAGTTLVTGTTLVSVYGSAYDGYSKGGPYLWFFSQTAVAGYGTAEDRVMIQQYNIATNSLTGVFHCAIDIPGYQTGGIAGGAFATDLLIPGKYVLMVNVQATPNLVGVYELENTGNWLDLSGYNGVIQPTDDQDIQVNFNTAGLEEGTYNATIKITHDGQNVTKGLVEIPVTMHVYPPCPKPVDLTVDNITQTSAVLNWTAIGNETTWNLKYGAPGFDPETEGTLVGGITKPYLLEGLNHSTDYAFRVQAVCDVKELSNWSKEKVFLTLCGANELPFVEDFEGVGFPPKCWNIYDLDGGGTQWVVSSAQNHTPGGSKSAYHQWASGDQDGWLVTPQIQLPEDLGINLSFWSFNLYPGDYGENSVLISTGSGDPEDEEFELLWSPETVTQPWEETLIPLTDYAGEDVYIAFRYTGDNAHGWYVDDVQVFVPGNVEGYVSEATSPKNRTPIEGARVFTAHYEAFTDASGYYKLEGLPAGIYDISCEAEGYFISIEENFEIVEDDTKSLNFTLDYAQIAVNPDEFDVVLPHESIKIEKLTISNPNGTAPLTWNASMLFSRRSYTVHPVPEGETKFIEANLAQANSIPGGAPRENLTRDDEIVLHYDGDNDSAIGAGGGELSFAARFPSAMVAQYAGFSLEYVDVYIWDVPFGSTLMIWGAGTTTEPGTLLYQQEFEAVEEWNTINLDEPLLLDGTDIWVGYHVEYDAGEYPGGCDEGPADPDGAWIFINGGWHRLYELNPDFDYNWNIRAYLLPPSGSWLSISPKSGVVPVGGSSEITVIFNSAGLEEGDYHATIKVNHDGQEVGKGVVNVPVTMGVYPHCRKPKDLTATLVNPTDFELGWTPMGETSVFNVILTDDAAFEIGGAIDPYDSFEGIEDNLLFIEDLQPETDYWFYVQADCGEAELNTPEVDRFWLDINTQGNIVPANSGGTANEPGEDGTWRLYTDTVTGQSYYSIWFYNSPLDMYGMNKMKMGFYVQKSNPIAAANVSFVVSYSTPDWDPDTTGFPMPDDEEFILRSPANGPYILTVTGQNKQWFELEFDIPDYNPEWISVSIIGSNIKIANTTWTKPTSLIGLDEYWDVNATGCGIIVHENLPQPKSAWAGPKKFTTLPLCPTPTNLTVSDITTTSAVFDWVAGFDETTWNLKYYKVGVGDTVFANSITKPYPCTGLTSNTNYAFKVQADCGSDVSAWSVAKAFKTPCETYPLPFAEDFTGLATGTLPACWQVMGLGLTNWSVVASANAGGTSPEMRFYYSPSFTGTTRLVTPELATGGTSDLMVSFNQQLSYYAAFEGAYIAVEYSVDLGATWEVIYKNFFNATLGPRFEEFYFSVPENTDEFMLAFTFYGYAYNINGWYIDNIVIDVAPTCLKPVELTATDITTTSALLEWTAGGTETKWNIKYGEPGFDPETEGTLISGITTNPFLLEGLNSSTDYAFSVQADCGEGDVSAWSVKKTFATLCETISNFPWTESFEGVTIDAIPNCWFKESGNWVTTNNANSTYDADARTGTQFLRERWGASNAYIWTPGFAVQAGKTYEFSFWWAGDNYAGWTGDVFMNTLQISTGATQVGTSFVTSGTTTTKTYAQFLHTFVPEVDGIYYFAIRVNSTSSPWYISFDDFEFNEIQTGPPQNQTVSGLLEDCYDALEVLTIENAQVEEGNIAEFRAGETINATDFEVEEDAVAYLYAGQNIVLGEGVHVAQGADFLATIMDEITYCEQAAAMVTAKSEEIAPAVITPAEMDAMFTVFPNPTTGRFTLMMKEADESSVINVEIFGLMGERVLQTQLFGQNQYEFDLSGSPKGVYIVRVLNGKQISIEKLIKQ